MSEDASISSKYHALMSMTPRIITIFILVLLAGSFGLEYVLGKVPCALCLGQRYGLILMLLWWLVCQCSARFKSYKTIHYLVAALLSMVILNFAVFQYMEQQLPHETFGFCAAGQDLINQSGLFSFAPDDLASCSEPSILIAGQASVLYLLFCYILLTLMHVIGFFYHRFGKENATS